MERPAISPSPPTAHGVGLPWDVAVEDPVAALTAARNSLGDTFIVDSGPDRYLFTFSPEGVAAFYALPEERASKGMADLRMLRRKLPGEVFRGRRTFPHELFGRDDVATYLLNLEAALDAALDELGDAGEVDLFAFTRRLGHRMGLASWGGPGSATGGRFDGLAAAFDVLAGSDAFVHPDAMAAVAASDKAAEREALAVAVELLGEAVDGLPGAETHHALFARMADRWADEAPDERRPGVALDAVLVHVASMSNLFAALGWAIADLVEHPDALDAVAGGDAALAERCALESTRLAQRSIMARYVLEPVVLPAGDTVHEVAPGATVATLLPVTNTTAGPGLAHWDPDRWKRRRLADAAALPAPELVTAFGHGHHTCPAQPFSLAAMSATLRRLAGSYRLEAGWERRPVPVPAQIGGVARATDPCPLRYRRS